MLRALPNDCLLQGQLHPNIKERLERIRQIPHMGVGTLLGVERDESGAAWLVWDLIDGKPLVDVASDPARSMCDVASLVRELTLEVESFHSLGLVHGALGADSVMVDREGKIRLTDVSPLLHHDPAVDGAAVRAMLREIVERRDARESGLDQIVVRAEDEQWPLRTLRMNLASLLESPDGAIEPAAAPRAARRVRVGALLAASIIAITGIVVAVVLYSRVQNAMPKPLTPPVLK